MSLLEKTLKGIQAPNEDAMKKALEYQDTLAKPLGSLGVLEDISIKIAGMTGNVKNSISKKCMVVMSADNGVCDEGVSACPQEVTAAQTINFLRGVTGIGVLARQADADLRVVDIGVERDIEYPGLIKRKIRYSTANMSKEPAMTREEAIKAIEVGIEIVDNAVKEGYNLFGTGEMGIGNTSTSSAVLMSLTGISADLVVGKGAGLTEEAYENKKRVIKKALSINKPDPADPLDVLSKVGGLDIAGMAGCFISAAYHRMPIVIDGFISAVAAFVAFRMNPLVSGYLIPSHCSAEPGYIHVMKEMGLSPMLNLNMRLGEGTGCPIAFHVIEAALSIVNEMATFEQASIVNDFMVDIR